jgi:hypothetical protein
VAVQAQVRDVPAFCVRYSYCQAIGHTTQGRITHRFHILPKQNDMTEIHKLCKACINVKNFIHNTVFLLYLTAETQKIVIILESSTLLLAINDNYMQHKLVNTSRKICENFKSKSYINPPSRSLPFFILLHF